MASWAPCTAMASRAASSAIASVLSVPLWRSPSCVPVRVCLEGPPERPPPLPDGTVKARDEPFGRGELCQGSVVCHVFPPHVSLFGLFPVLVKCHYELIHVQPCLSNYLWFTCVFIVLSVQFDFVWSTRYFPGVSCPCKSCLVLPCPPLMSTLKTIIWVYVLVCVFLFLPCVCTMTNIQYLKNNVFFEH